MGSWGLGRLLRCGVEGEWKEILGEVWCAEQSWVGEA